MNDRRGFCRKGRFYQKILLKNFRISQEFAFTDSALVEEHAITMIKLENSLL